MQNKKKLWTALHFLMITVGTFVYSVALEMFLVPNLVLDGGLTGISLMINYQTGILLGLLTFLLNIPFVVLGWRMLGLRFAGSYLYAMILLSGFTALLHNVAPVTDNELLSVVFGGILLGIGVGLVIKGGACLDGTELLAMLCSKRLPVSVGQVILFLNLVIFSVAAKKGNFFIVGKNSRARFAFLSSRRNARQKVKLSPSNAGHLRPS